MSMSQPVAQLVASLTDAFESVAEDLPAAGLAEATTLAECVPLLAIAVELINRGPASLTIEGVERYRTRIMQLLEHVRPAVESEAKRSLAEWTSRLLDEPMPTRLAA
jgi:hypothetical protein